MRGETKRECGEENRDTRAHGSDKGVGFIQTPSWATAIYLLNAR
jgi:hypothetical protein